MVWKSNFIYWHNLYYTKLANVLN